MGPKSGLAGEGADGCDSNTGWDPKVGFSPLLLSPAAGTVSGYSRKGNWPNQVPPPDAHGSILGCSQCVPYAPECKTQVGVGRRKWKEAI